MPLHDYYCLNCQRVFEVIVPLKKTDNTVKCPKCRKALKKRIAPVRLKRYGNT